MASKSDILNNLREYTSDQIVEAINAGIVTIYELSKSGNLTPLMRRRIEEKLAAKPTEVVMTSTEVNQSTNEVAPTLDEDEPPVDTSNSDYEDNVVIPVVSDIDIPFEKSCIACSSTFACFSLVSALEPGVSKITNLLFDSPNIPFLLKGYSILIT